MGRVRLSPDCGSIRLIEPASPAELQAYYGLRWKVLREPWQQPPGSERDTLDASSIHLLAVAENGTALGVGRLHFNSIREAQIRYMAVATSQQRRGIGSCLLQALERRAAALGAACIVLDAREAALGFYHKRGYVTLGPGHVLYNCISHARMYKTL